MWWLLLHWRRRQFTSTTGLSGSSIGLFRAQCSGPFLCLDMIGNVFFLLSVSHIVLDVCVFYMVKFFLSAFNSGHGSFSNSSFFNNLVGHILHSSILVPYHGWLVHCISFPLHLSFDWKFFKI